MFTDPGVSLHKRSYVILFLFCVSGKNFKVSFQNRVDMQGFTSHIKKN